MGVTELQISNVNINGTILKLVIEFMNHHAGEHPPPIEKPLKDNQMKTACKDSWDATWIDEIGKDRKTLYGLVEVGLVFFLFRFFLKKKPHTCFIGG